MQQNRWRTMLLAAALLVVALAAGFALFAGLS